jgi:hypothetical protein
MLRRFEARQSRTKVTAKVFEVARIQRFAALITFITSRFSEATVRASTFQIAIGKESLALGAVSLKHPVLIDITLV